MKKSVGYHLTPAELENLRQDMIEASNWMREELARRYPDSPKPTAPIKDVGVGSGVGDIPTPYTELPMRRSNSFFLSEQEVDHLRAEMREASEWAKTELARRRSNSGEVREEGIGRG